MLEDRLTTPLVIRIATPEDISTIEKLDSFSTSPTRHIHREMHKYFGSVEPSTHERILIFLVEMNGVPAAKAELMLPPPGTASAVGYIKRVVVHPDFRQHGLARHLMEHIIDYAHNEQHLDAIDLHVWEDNRPAIRLYESLGFELQHRELYFKLHL
ncbi:MAG: GNAT family N-acetyltransferase [Ktedonobacteraceae bacterium]|nr:GNAT family N-acetyltransferase [Ktedonobacteraceae bacterium]